MDLLYEPFQPLQMVPLLAIGFIYKWRFVICKLSEMLSFLIYPLSIFQNQETRNCSSIDSAG